MPVLTVHAGRSAPGQRAAASHTAAVAAPLITRQALFEQAGIIATSSLGELLDAAALLANQPVPGGRRVAIVTNAGGAGVLAADACVEAGLSVAPVSAGRRRGCAGCCRRGRRWAGRWTPRLAGRREQFGECLLLVAGGKPAGGSQDPPDAVIALIVPTAAADLVPAIQASRLPVPLAAVVLDQPETVRLLPSTSGAAIPAYAYPEAAARALGRAARYSAWRSRPAGTIPEITPISGRMTPGMWSARSCPGCPAVAGSPHRGR